MDLLTLALIFGGGILAGVINTVAGGGSIISLPLLIFAGLPATVANGTNRVAIVLQGVGAMAGFKKHGYTIGGEAWLLLIPTSIGALLGARLAVGLDEVTMRRVIGGVLVIMLVPLLRKGRGQESEGPVSPPTTPWVWPVYLLIGAYGGFLQVGVGFMYLAFLVGVHNLDLVRANLLKIFFVLVYSVLVLGVFVLEDQVALGPGLVLAAGMAWGGWLGARLAVEKGERWIRVVLVVTILLSAVKLTGILDSLLSGLQTR